MFLLRNPKGSTHHGRIQFSNLESQSILRNPAGVAYNLKSAMHKDTRLESRARVLLQFSKIEAASQASFVYPSTDDSKRVEKFLSTI